MRRFCQDRIVVTELATGATTDWQGAFGDPQTNTFSASDPKARLVPMRELSVK